jgi:N utilization substance protein A
MTGVILNVVHFSGQQVGFFHKEGEKVMEDINIKQLTLAVRTIAEEKNLPEEVVLSVIEQAIAAAWRRDNGERDQEVRAELNVNDGTANVFVAREVVEEVGSDAVEISLEDAKKVKSDAVIGDTIEEKFEVVSFGRVAAQTAKQVVLQRLREAEREVVLEEYEDKIGTIVNGTVQRVEPRVIRVELGKATGIIPQSEQIQGEFYSIGSRIKVFIKDIERDNRGPQLILSRGNEAFVEYLFRQEVPEMETGAVEIKAIAREAGRRTKLAVISTVPGVDPVGTFVGGHGTRVQAVMNEIGDQEKIDIITFDENNEQFIRNALSPAEVVRVEIDEAAKRAKVFVYEDQQSIAIGRGGQNVRLASRLTGYELDIETAQVAAEKPTEA